MSPDGASVQDADNAGHDPGGLPALPAGNLAQA
jgi:hypothetical protein